MNSAGATSGSYTRVESHVRPDHPGSHAALPVERLHERYVRDRRVRVLSRRIAELIPQGARVLDVGCGDGRLSRLIKERRPDASIVGVEFLVRPDTEIPVTPFDGTTIPHPGRSFDTVMMVDVLHHTVDPSVLLGEAARVSRRHIVLKDHCLEGVLAGPTLRFMDWVGNARHGVPLPYNYWPRSRWRDAFARAGLKIEQWAQSLGLYPLPAGWIFDRRLHFLARLRIPGAIPEA